MIDHQHNAIIIECDSCSETFSGEKGEQWDAVWPAAKRDGWHARRIANEWLHGCPRCGVPT
jgi:hypothetical protein